METTDKRYRIEGKITFEYINHVANALQLFKRKAFGDFKKASGSNPAFYCYTFRQDDFERSFTTIECDSRTPDYIILTAPEAKIKTAFAKMVELNNHLVLTIAEKIITAFDCEHGYITHKVRFTNNSKKTHPV